MKNTFYLNFHYHVITLTLLCPKYKKDSRFNKLIPFSEAPHYFFLNISLKNIVFHIIAT